jgi:biopolymer transport protein TolQ
VGSTIAERLNVEIGVLQDASLLSLVSGASVAVKMVLGILLGVSLLSWWQIFIKFFVLRLAKHRADKFEQAFWQGGDMNQLAERIAHDGEQSGEMGRIFTAGFREYGKLKNQGGVEPSDVADSTRRAMRASFQRQLDALESNMSYLATVGSVSPYVGLFGTVWGIMNAFRNLSNVGQATLANVAPGIAEALVATAMGLFAAIPAVVAYNHYAREIDQLANRFESFLEEFANILQRQAIKR